MASIEEYEIFAQKTRNAPLSWVGSVTAPSDELAFINARENYLRRDSCIAVWVVPRRAIVAGTEEDVPYQRSLPKKFWRQPSFFTQRAKQRGLQSEGVE